MARARTLKPQFFTDAKLVKCDFWVRLLFAGLWTQADRRGILVDDPEQLALDIFPRDDVDVDAGLTELAQRGVIERYEVDGLRCIAIGQFTTHQKPHPKEPENGLPAPSREHPRQAVALHGEQGFNLHSFPSVSSSSSDSVPRVRAREDTPPSANGGSPHPAEAAEVVDDLPTTTVRPVPPAVTAFERDIGDKRFATICEQFAAVNVQLDASWLRRTLGQLEIQGHGLSPPAYRDAVKQAFLVVEDALKRENQIRNPRAYAAKQLSEAVNDAGKAVVT